MYDDLVAAGIDRSGIVVALGGGVVGDMAGFAAATYLRGIRFVQIPTTLLAMVDSSIGGKTGVDLPQGKNLVGAFKQPELVVVDPDVLSTLPSAEFRNGLGEVVKHGIISDPVLFAQLQADGPESLESMLARALRVKIGVVERDPFEQGERAHLNLGHTFAHAFEQVSRYAIPHGQAVSVGLMASAHLSVISGHCQPDLPARIEDVLDRLVDAHPFLWSRPGCPGCGHVHRQEAQRQPCALCPAPRYRPSGRPRRHRTGASAGGVEQGVGLDQKRRIRCVIEKKNEQEQ